MPGFQAIHVAFIIRPPPGPNLSLSRCYPLAHSHSNSAISQFCGFKSLSPFDTITLLYHPLYPTAASSAILIPEVLMT